MRKMLLLGAALLALAGCSDGDKVAKLPEGPGAWLIVDGSAYEGHGEATVFARFDDGAIAKLEAPYEVQPMGMGGRFIEVKAQCGSMRFLVVAGEIEYWHEGRGQYLEGARSCGFGGRTHYRGWKIIIPS